MPERDIVVIGASAGGLEPLMTIIKGLQDAPPLAVLVVTHTSASSGSALSQILARQSEWPWLAIASSRSWAASTWPSRIAI
jgi:two-component system chemotaxis response regulator CheB